MDFNKFQELLSKSFGSKAEEKVNYSKLVDFQGKEVWNKNAKYLTVGQKNSKRPPWVLLKHIQEAKAQKQIGQPWDIKGNEKPCHMYIINIKKSYPASQYYPGWWPGHQNTCGDTFLYHHSRNLTLPENVTWSLIKNLNTEPRTNPGDPHPFGLARSLLMTIF